MIKLWTKMAMALLGCCLAGAATAADERGNYSARGAGLLSCEAYTKERAAQSDAYWMIGGWIDGYITATNAHRSDTYDITAYQGTEMISEILARHCKAHPTQRLFSVLTAMVRELHEQRVSKASPRQSVVVKDQRTALYNATITRMQIALIQQGLFKHHQVSGQFDKATASALAKFQSRREFEPTGFPDQATLWLLFADSVSSS